MCNTFGKSTAGFAGLTGDLAAPLIAAGTDIMIGGAGAMALTSAAGVSTVGSLFGVAGGGLTGSQLLFFSLY